MHLIVNPKISVIVPVYNTEKYLTKCLDGILAQTFTDFELLLIDDGSQDQSGKICDDYASKDERIRVFHKNNGGVSSARQLGVKHARGIYSIHFDSDDWVELNMLEEMHKYLIENNADMIITDYFLEKPNKTIYRKHTLNSLLSDNIIYNLLDRKIMGSLCNKLIRHRYYNNIIFPNLRLYEDAVVLIQILLQNPKVMYYPKAYYHYRYNQLSLTHSKKSEKDFIAYGDWVDTILSNQHEKYEKNIISLKLNIKVDILLHCSYDRKNFENLWADTNIYITNTNSISWVKKIALLSAIYNIRINVIIIRFLNKLLKYFTY